MSRIYTVSFSGDIAAADADVDLFELLPADDKPIRLVGLVLGQSTEVGDTQEEGIRIDIIRLPATVTSGSGGSAPTPAPIDSADAAAGFTAETKNTTVATTSGTAVTVDRCPWNLRGSPLERWWLDERVRPIARQGEALIVRWQTTVADTVTVDGTAYIEEI